MNKENFVEVNCNIKKYITDEALYNIDAISIAVEMAEHINAMYPDTVDCRIVDIKSYETVTDKLIGIAEIIYKILNTRNIDKCNMKLKFNKHLNVILKTNEDYLICRYITIIYGNEIQSVFVNPDFHNNFIKAIYKIFENKTIINEDKVELTYLV